jgi:hypothetical protein
MRTRILLALLIVGGTAQASEWVSLGKSDDGTREAFVDVSDIRVLGDMRRAWVKVDAATATTMYREAFNCAEETSRSEAIDIHSSDGSVKSAPDNLLQSTPWRPIRPDTTWQVVMKFVCAWHPR